MIIYLFCAMFKNIQEIRKAIEVRDGVLTIQMESLRDAYGSGKLGRHVLDGISRELKNNGLGHFPENLPSYQHEYVRVYLLGSQISMLIEAVNKVGEESDDILRSASGGHDAEILRKVRELVC